MGRFDRHLLLMAISTFVAVACCGTIYSDTRPASLSLDSFGGFEDIRANATGWFHIEKIAERDTLVAACTQPGRWCTRN